VSAHPLYSRSGCVLWRRVGPQVLVADPEGGEIGSLSEPASAAWLFLERPRTQFDLTDALAETFATARDEVATHVEHMLGVLEQRGWVTVAAEDG
jgi:hypothetical protein